MGFVGQRQRTRTVCNEVNGVVIGCSSMWTHDADGKYAGICTSAKSGHYKTRKMEGYGKKFYTHEEMDKFQHEQGYSQEYFGRPNCFIQLRLSPRTRKYLKNKPLYVVKSFLLKLGREGSDYIKSVLEADYNDETSKKWLHYVRTGGQDIVFHADKWK